MAYAAYREEVAQAAAHFQFLEEALKMYLATSFDVIRLTLGTHLHFTYTYKDVSKFTLARLIHWFSKYNGNEALLKTLRPLPELRNRIAHRAYLLTSDEMRDADYLSRELERVKEVVAKADSAVKEMFDELTHLTAIKASLANDSI